MAAKKTNSKAKNKTKSKSTQDDMPTKRIVAFSVGILLLFIALFLIVAFTSFIFSSSDKNACGTLGLMAAQNFVNKGFGIASYLIPAFMIVAGLHLIGSYKFNLLKIFVIMAIIMIWLSFVVAVISPDNNSAVSFGGDHGRKLDTLLENVVGKAGVIILIVISILVFLVYLSTNTIDYVTKTLRVGKINRLRELADKLKEKVNGNSEEKDAADESTEPTTFTDPESSTITYDKDGNLVAINDKDSIGDDLDVTKDVNKGPVILDDDVYWETEKEKVQENEASDVKEDKIIDPTFTIDKPRETEKGKGEIKRGDIDTPYDPRLDLEHYKFPPLSLIKSDVESSPKIDLKEQNENKERIIHVLKSFGVEISSIKATIGPTITLYEITPAEGVRITKIRNLEDDIALSLAAEGIRIIAPIPGKGTIGIEVPNKKKCIVSMESILNSKTYQETTMDLPCALGKTITNEVFMVDLAKAPHMLVAGATGMGKSVGLNAIVTSLLYKKHPSELKIVMVDPKKVEFSVYSPIANQFLAKLEDEDEPIITDNDRVVKTLKALCKLMDDRYALLKKAHVRNIKEYNDLFKARRLNPLEGHMFMPYYVVIIDEFGDLIMTAGKEVELPICRIAQLARAIGIHMIIATQRPTTNIITGTIKANFPARIAFRVTSGIDSKIILDRPGANQLIGRGDMLYLQNADPVRVQCAFVDTPEVKKIVDFISKQQQYPEMTYLPEPPSEDGDAGGKDVDMAHLDPMFADVAKMVVGQNAGSTSLIQRKFSIGYNRAGRLMDQLERAGIVGPQQGSKPRDVLISDLITLDSILNTLGVNN